MDNGSSIFLFFTLMLLGAVLISVLAVIFYRWSSHLIEKRRYFAVGFWVPILLIGVFFVIPPAFTILYSIFYPGYELHADESPGPMGDGLGGFLLVLWPFGIFVLLIYAVANFFRLFRVERAEPAKPE